METLQNLPEYFKYNCYYNCSIERCRELQRFLQTKLEPRECFGLNLEITVCPFDRKTIENAIEELRKIKNACDALDNA